MLYAKLTLRNIKRSIREYALFMFTMTMSMTLIYTFIAVFQSERVTQISMYLQKFSENILPLLAVMIIIIISWLINYVVHCIFRKRSREFGLYLLSGMKRTHVMMMFLCEQLLLGLIALGVGLLIGVLLSQIMEYVITVLFGMEFTFVFAFHPIGVMDTLIVFVLLYAVEMIKEARMIGRIKIVDLLYLSSKNESNHISKKKSIVMFLLAIISVVVGFFLLFQFKQRLSDPVIKASATSVMVAVVLVFLSVYFFYMSFSDIMMLYLRTFKTKKYKKNVMFLNAQLCARMRSNRFVLASLSILIITIIFGLTFSFVFKSICDKQIEEQLPYDIIAMSSDGIDQAQLEEYLEKESLSYQSASFSYYHMPEDLVQESLTQGLQGTRAYFPNVPSPFMKESEVQALAMLGGFDVPKQLKDGEYAILIYEDLKSKIESYAKQHPVQVEGKELSLGYVYSENLGQALYMDYIIVLPDASFKQIPSSMQGLFVNLDEPTTVKMQQELSSIVQATDGFRLFRVRTSYIKDQMSMYVMIVSTAIYLALIAICMCATMIATQQFSDTREQQQSYHLLSKLGLSKKERFHLIFQQVLGYFLIPLVVPMLYLPFMFYLMKDFLELTAVKVSIAPAILFSTVLFLVIYGCYFVITYLGCKRNIEQKEVL